MKSILAILIAVSSFNAFAKCRDADIVVCPEFKVVKTVCDDGYNQLSAVFGEDELFNSALGASGEGKWEGRNQKNQPVYISTSSENGETVYRTSTLVGRDLTPAQVCTRVELQPRASKLQAPPVAAPATTISR